MNPKRKRIVKTSVTLAIFFIIIYKFGPSLYSNVKRWASSSFCDVPVTYTLGNIDERFGVTDSQLKDYLNSAADIWKNAYGRELFVYDPDSTLEVNMVYDERQSSLENIQSIENLVDKRKMDIESASQTYDSLIDSIKAKTKTLNDEIAYWNSKGGAPKDEYNDITRRQQELSKEVDYVNALGEKLNKDVDNTNLEINSLNNKISTFNSILNFKPEIGIYTSGENKIDIYFYSDQKYLVNVLAHEMGHALGLGHIEYPNAIMNPEISDDTSLTQGDIDLIQNYCSEKNRIDLIKNDVQNYVYTLLSDLSLFLESHRNK